ncbi:MAG: ABC transporter ATP-binding protein [Thermanaerothrix sp.]|jgi:peptide/nickel transport system ATP-binding protein|uniref:ABC transporter ATP-binding protein n=1 Tax=Thermanaerothrix solaris TaxID=3058434 RepID=A0ABU3NQ49_9CHLR|nr:ABC transporter ATP-binding protein [Thermanaerothrix sp. 4228-RoL]MDT8898525.1 ABC transporter ATP-binding protein [Thermanaerothrix sp. 4228-RoL]
MAEKPLLSVRNLSMIYKTRKGAVSAIDNVSFDLKRGESLGLVGESGCGKTSVAMALLRLLPDNAQITGGQILLDGVDLTQLSEDEMQNIRWKRISMVFQAAMNALDPVYKVGDQIIEAIERHERDIDPAEARKRVEALFKLVGIDPKMADRYPHEFSGGMRQRAIIAMALACNPDLIIADEPTTALDVIVQDQVLRELRQVQKQMGMSMIYISHDIAVIAEVAERIAIMYAGRMCELASAVEIFKRPRHPYTVALMSAFPSIVGEKRPLVALGGEPPDLLFPPPGCRFHPRCPRALDICKQQQPPFEDIGGGHYLACWNPAPVVEVQP